MPLFWLAIEAVVVTTTEATDEAVGTITGLLFDSEPEVPVAATDDSEEETELTAVLTVEAAGGVGADTVSDDST